MDEVKRRGPYAKSGLRRAAIVAAAFDVFAERGYNSGSFQDIADRVGMSQTSLLHYFPTKSALLLAVLAHRDEIADERATTPADFVSGIRRRAGSNTSVPGLIQLYTVLCGEATTADHPGRDYFRQRFSDLRAGFAADLAELQSRGLLAPGVDPARAAATLVALWDGIQAQWLFDSNAVDVELCLADYLRLILPQGTGADMRQREE